MAHEMPLLGHRNWVLVVDSAYPLQTAPGVETIETHEKLEDVLKATLEMVDRSVHVRPAIFMDSELRVVPDADAPGASKYRARISSVLRDLPVKTLPHDQIIRTIDEAGKSFHVLVLKTSSILPYSSVFIQLECRYWSADAEQKLRNQLAVEQK